jgi:Tol biopolymer transport system component
MVIAAALLSMLLPFWDIEQSLQPAWSPDGKQIAFVGHLDGNQDIFVVTIRGKRLRRITSATGNDFSPCWSPDGQSIAFTSEHDGQREVYIADLNGNNVHPLLASRMASSGPAWSPDGSKIAFTSMQEGFANIYVADADGKEVQAIVESPAMDGAPIWSRDGSVLGFNSDRSGDWNGYIMEFPSGLAKAITNEKAHEFLFDFFPDNTSVVLTTDKFGIETIVVSSLDGTRTQKISDPATRFTGPRVSPNGKQIACTKYEGNKASIVIIDLKTGGMRSLLPD